MAIKIALAGNPNAGKTTLFNALTGSNQFVGNWPGVTVEKKEGKLKKHDDVIVTDLPGIYSLSPYSLEEVVARNYLVEEKPDVILNIIDGTNLERNLYLTTQLTELGIPVVAAVNMMDVVRRNGDRINTQELGHQLGCKVFEISALKGTGVFEAAEAAVIAAKGTKTIPQHRFSGPVEHAIAHIEENVLHDMPEEKQRWYAIKLFERDSKVIEKLGISEEKLNHIENDIKAAEKELDDDAESIITNERYIYIAGIIKSVLAKKNKGALSGSDRIDRIITNRWLGLPIFAAIMFFVYFVSVTTAGTIFTDWANDGLFGEGWHLFSIGEGGYQEAAAEFENADPADYGIWIPGVPVVVEKLLNVCGVSETGCGAVIRGLVLDGIVGGVGAVLGFVPQILILFFFLAFLESCGYMARVAFVLDRIFRKFGLSGKSFIPLLISSGCGIPGIMASRTIENEKDRRMTIMTTTFIPCGAKVPFIAMIAGAIFGGAAWVAPSAYFLGIAAVICSGIILKKTKLFAGNPAPFVMELPAYHLPSVGTVLLSMWERGWSFIKKAGTIILLSTIIIWFLSFFGWTDGRFGMIEENQLDSSILAKTGNCIAWLFAPLGWGNWQSAVAAITGLVAKENIVGTLGILYGAGEGSVYETMKNAYSAGGLGISGYSFLVFNLLCAPCFAAMGAIRREMNNTKWFWTAIGYQSGFAYVVSLCVYRLGRLFTGGGFDMWSVVSLLLVGGFVYLLARRDS